jgi:hypothetical protein
MPSHFYAGTAATLVGRHVWPSRYLSSVRYRDQSHGIVDCQHRNYGQDKNWQDENADLSRQVEVIFLWLPFDGGCRHIRGSLLVGCWKRRACFGSEHWSLSAFRIAPRPTASGNSALSPASPLRHHDGERVTERYSRCNKLVTEAQPLDRRYTSVRSMVASCRGRG